MNNNYEPEYKIMETKSNDKLAIYRKVPIDELLKYYWRDERIVNINSEYWLMLNELENSEHPDLTSEVNKLLGHSHYSD
jgi:hypothetical protein